MKKFFVLIVCMTIFVFGCAKKEDSSSSVIATIDGTKITKKGFLDEFNRLPEWARDRFQGKEGKAEFLNELIKKELLYKEAEKMGLHRDKELKERIEEFRKMWLITNLLKKEVEEKAKAIDDKEIKGFYDKNPNEFVAGAEVKASHILVATEAEAKDILEKLKKGGDFSKLAKAFSKDKGSAVKGGDLGFFKRGAMVPEFEQVAFRLKIGEISDPVGSSFGYHIIKVTERKEGKKLEFEQVKDAIKGRLMGEKQKNIFDSLIENSKKKSKIKIDEKSLEALSL
ncbi:MAG: peptidylprolyl isomerase [Nitrospirae bacterium]|nr:peptidylprolyl isomerase [Nitrospirota bacterium]